MKDTERGSIGKGEKRGERRGEEEEKRGEGKKRER